MKKHYQYVGQDNDNNSIYDESKHLPIMIVNATEKIHGTNASVCYNNIDGFWVQSRKNIITIEKDNAGCAFSAMRNKKSWMSIIKELAGIHDIDLSKNTITIYFEWCGIGIQKNSALSGIDKLAMIFEYFKVSPFDPDAKARWQLTKHLSNKHARIYNIQDFPQYAFIIGLDFPKMAVGKFAERIVQLEKQSPVGLDFGKENNIGEGLVCTFMDEDDNLHMFKVKGDKHTTTKVKKLKIVDEAKEQKLIEFANKTVTAGRLEQAWQYVFGIENEKHQPSMKATGEIIKFVVDDIIKEESAEMFKQNITPNECNGKIAAIARNWFIEQLKEFNLK